MIDAELVLKGNQEAQVLSGDINVLRSDYLRDINLLEQLANRGNTPSGPLTSNPFLLGLRLEVDIHSDGGLFVDNQLTRLRGSLRLTLRGTPAYPYLTGRVEANEGSIFSVATALTSCMLRRISKIATESTQYWMSGRKPFLKSLRVSLDFAAGRVLLSDGWVEVNNKSIPLDLQLTDLTCEIRYSADPPCYRIRIAYKNSRLLWLDSDIVHGIDARVRLGMAGVDIDSLEIVRGRTRLLGDGWVRDWRSPVLLLHAAGNLDAEDLAIFSSDLRDARGGIDVATNFRIGEAGFRFDGKFKLPAGGFRGAALSFLRGTFEIRDDVLLLKEVDGKLGEGIFEPTQRFSLRRPTNPCTN